jgi:antitoxin component of MazEF toxin-antitoxin module
VTLPAITASTLGLTVGFKVTRVNNSKTILIQPNSAVDQYIDVNAGSAPEQANATLSKIGDYMAWAAMSNGTHYYWGMIHNCTG